MSERVDVPAIAAALGLEDCREGSRAIGHCGPENDEWEDYIEVPVSKLAAVAELVEADREYDATKEALLEARRARGNWNVNPLPHSHPAVVAHSAASLRRATALDRVEGKS